MLSQPRALLVFAGLSALCACNGNKTEAAPQPAAPPPPAAASTPPPAAKPAATVPPQVMQDPGAQNAVPVSRAIAVLEPTKGSHVHGTVIFTAHPGGGLDVKAELAGLPPGMHAYHVHEFGDCSSEDGKSAGTHFNFTGSSDNPTSNVITGNLGELKAERNGSASATATIEQASLQGKYSILGRTVIVHEKGNDPKSPPMGAAGGRLACGVIGIANSAVMQHAASITPAHSHKKG